ncbi:MAG TPA: substrate-binding domain-containing protein [Opitutaceae bacterium]|nr:substrate-binding domain-containing protein [Opitutaceae bacterium]
MKRLLALLACGAAAAAAPAPLQIAVIPKSVGNEYWEAVHAGAAKAEADLTAQGVAVKIYWDGTEREDQIDLQRQIVAKYVGRKVDAIVLAPMHAQALIGAADDATAAKIPVVLIDSPLAGGSVVSTVATNNYKAGLLAGRRLGEALGGKGKVALFRYMKGHGSTQPRESGFLDAMKKFPEIEVISASALSGPTVAEATASAKALLAQSGAQLQGVFASNLTASEGMLAALRAEGRAGKISFVGFDSSDAEIEALRKGEMAGFAVQQPFMMGYLGVQTAVAKLQGKPVDHEVDTDVKIVTKENLETPEVKKLLNPSAS